MAKNTRLGGVSWDGGEGDPALVGNSSDQSSEVVVNMQSQTEKSSDSTAQETERGLFKTRKASGAVRSTDTNEKTK